MHRKLDNGIARIDANTIALEGIIRDYCMFSHPFDLRMKLNNNNFITFPLTAMRVPRVGNMLSSGDLFPRPSLSEAASITNLWHFAFECNNKVAIIDER